MRENDEATFRGVLFGLFQGQKERALEDPGKMLLEDELMADALAASIETIALAEAWGEYQKLIARRQIESLWEKIKAWVKGYSVKLAREINQTSWDMLEVVLKSYASEGWTMGELTAAVADIFGEARAQRIAVTEVTRAYVEGSRIAADEVIAQGIQMIEIWHTDNDDLVCELCGPLDGEPIGIAWDRGMGPPLHPNCRCWTTFEVV